MIILRLTQLGHYTHAIADRESSGTPVTLIAKYACLYLAADKRTVGDKKVASHNLTVRHRSGRHDSLIAHRLVWQRHADITEPRRDTPCTGKNNDCHDDTALRYGPVPERE